MILQSTLHTQVIQLRDSLVTAAGQSPIAQEAWCELPGNQPPWQRSGLHITKGQTYSLFAAGRIQWSASSPERYGGPSFHLWARVSPGGKIANLSADSGTFNADVSGEIELGIYMGVWRDAYGNLATSENLYQRLSGTLACWLIVWRASAEAGLEKLCALPTGEWVTRETARLATEARAPTGWDYLLETGIAAVYHDDWAQGRRIISLDAEDEQGIITAPVDIPLTPETRLHWSWRPVELPSRLPENRTHTHDYFSVGAEFDNGRDLTWMWSAALPPNTHFPCPVPAWSLRETHFVVRSGLDGIGIWHAEQRAVYADVATAMGPPPARIVRIWIIGLASFQHGRARAEFADIYLENGATRVTVL